MKTILRRIVLFMLFASLLFSPSAHALESKDVLVVANNLAFGSVKLARYYMQKRSIPEENLLKLNTIDGENVSREEYNLEIAEPVRKHLQKKRREGKRYRCLVVMYGMPLRVSQSELTGEEEKRLEELRKDRGAFSRKLKGENLPEEEKKMLQASLGELRKEINRVGRNDEIASLDSELALVMREGYPLAGRVPNPYFAGFSGKITPVGRGDVLMVSRLDGLDEDMVKRIIDDSLAAEATGLEGTAYFDARFPRPEKEVTDGYALYDRSIHRAADAVTESGRMKVVLDAGNDLLPPGSAPDAALYCGWYSYGRYVDAFTWRRGAVGYHIASGECLTLKKKNGTGWCKMMLEKGAAATIGPVGEPYVQAFPSPEIFFKALLGGEFTLVEAFMVSSPTLSWKMVLVGDPLYRPFRKRH